MKDFFFIPLILFFSVSFLSCQKKSSQKLNLIESNPTKAITSFKSDWARENVPLKWIEVKKDSKGYLIYKPCDGETFFIDFNPKKKSAEIHWALEPEYIEFYYLTTINNDKDFFVLLAEKEKTIFEAKFKEYDSKNQIVRVTFDDYEFLMTPFVNLNSFRKIENKCDKKKVSELEFLPIN